MEKRTIMQGSYEVHSYTAYRSCLTGSEADFAWMLPPTEENEELIVKETFRVARAGEPKQGKPTKKHYVYMRGGIILACEMDMSDGIGRTEVAEGVRTCNKNRQSGLAGDGRCVRGNRQRHRVRRESAVQGCEGEATARAAGTGRCGKSCVDSSRARRGWHTRNVSRRNRKQRETGGGEER